MSTKSLRYISIVTIFVALFIAIISWIRKQEFPKQIQLKNLIHQIEKQENEYLGKYVIDQMCSFQKDSLTTKLFSSYYQTSRLFLFLKEDECLPCIYNIMDLLKKKNKNYIHANSLIFISCPDNTYYFDKNILILQKVVSGELEKEHSFFFELDKEGKVTSIHIITNADMERTRKYIENNHF